LDVKFGGLNTQEGGIYTMRKAVLVTGSTGNIGQAIARTLANEGYDLILHTHSRKQLAQEMAEEFRKKDIQTEIIQFDLNDTPSIETALNGISKSPLVENLYGLVNNSGLTRDNMSVLMSDDEFKDVINVNLTGAFSVSRWVARRLIRSRHGSIVNLASISGQVGRIGQVNYSASKGGLMAMTKTMAEELGPRGIRVNAIAAGIIESEMTRKTPELKDFIDMIPLRRFGNPDEVAHAVSFLVSSKSSYVTGSVMNVNGGLFRG
jgi:3-oxoacyl-[acyl-carrier protein] reductase